MRYELVNPFIRKSILSSIIDDHYFNINEHFSPKVEVIDKEHEYLLKVELPGLEKKDIDVEVKNNTLIISGERVYEPREENDYLKSEFSYGRFSRSFNLDGIDVEKINTCFENGVLKLILKKIIAKESKKIKIN